MSSSVQIMCWTCKQKFSDTKMHFWPADHTWICVGCRNCENPQCKRCPYKGEEES